MDQWMHGYFLQTWDLDLQKDDVNNAEYYVLYLVEIFGLRNCVL